MNASRNNLARQITLDFDPRTVPFVSFICNNGENGKLGGCIPIAAIISSGREVDFGDIGSLCIALYTAERKMAAERAIPFNEERN